MRKSIFCPAALLTCIAGQTALAQLAPTLPKPQLASNYGNLPLSFEANRGQSDPAVKFLSRGNGYSLFLTGKSAVLALTKSEPCSKNSTVATSPFVISTGAKRSGGICGSINPQANNETDTIRMELSHSNPNATIEGADQLPGTANYFLGNDPAKWRTNVPTYSKVKYKSVYPGVDLVYYGNQRQLEYDFIVQPHANPNQVKLHFAGAAKLTLTAQGDLMVAAKNGEIAFHKPVIYQNATNQARNSTSQRKPVDGHFVLLANSSVGFAVGTYDRGRDLVIDPTLAYSTYLGGAGSDGAYSIAIDSAGNAYVTGYTLSSKFPTANPYQQTNSDTSNGVAFVTKLNAEGTALIYSTYLGGSTACALDTLGISLPGDVGNGIAVDADGNAYVAGQACSKDFPTTKGAFQTINNAANSKAPNAFVTKLDPAGTSLLYSTFVGGTGQSNAGDVAQAIVTDSSGAAYIGGTAFSSNFPTTSGAFQTSNNTVPGDSAFVSKINASGSGLVYSTYLDGASGPSDVFGIAADSAGNAYVTGYVQSRNFPVTSNAFQSSFKGSSPGGVNAFLSKLNPTGSGLLYSTYLGGSGDNTVNYGDYGDGIAIDGAGNAYIGGETYSHDFPISSGSYQTKNNVAVGQPTGFAAKLNTETGALVFSTYMGGSGADAINGIAIDVAGNAYLAGFTYSTDFPTAGGPYQTTNKAAANKSYNAFITELNSTGSSLSYSSYFGGNGVAKPLNGDSAAAIAFSAGAAYMAGAAASTNFPTTASAYQSANKASAGNTNAFIAQFEFATPTTTTLTSDGNPEPLGGKVTFTADVTGTAGSGIPTGTVGFSIDKGAPIVIALDDTGHTAYSTTTLTAGVHSVVATYSGDPTHQASASAAFSQTIYGPAATITAASGSGQTSTYGTAFAKPLVVLVKDSAGDVVPGATVTFSGTGLKFSSTTVSTGANGEASVTATPIAVGTLTASASVTGAKTPATFTLTATKATLTVTATNQTIAYNAAIPSPLPYTIAGYVNSDTSKAVTGAPVLTTTATKGSQPGTYPITVALGTLAATDYTFKLVNGTLTITALGVTATPAATQTITIADATAGYAVYYTTNGTTPTTSSTKYTGPITITATETLKFIAVAPGYTPSAVKTVADTIQ